MAFVSVFATGARWCLVCLLLSQAGAGTESSAYEDVTERSGLPFRHTASPTPQKFLLETMGSGVAVLDYDLDGHLDLFFLNGAALISEGEGKVKVEKSAPEYWNRLYRNTGDAHFIDVTEAGGLAGHGYAMGVAVGDYDNDGDPDLYVTSYGGNTLYRNQGGRFIDVTAEAGVAGSGWSAAAAFLDFDNDGLLDLFVTRYLGWNFSNSKQCGDLERAAPSYCHPDEFPAVPHALFRNAGDGSFVDVSESAGFTSHPGKGLGVAINDFDADGWIDIVVANDSHPQQLFMNHADGTFRENGLLAGVAYDGNGNEFAGMGIDSQDYDNDGSPDILINALSGQTYALFRNRNRLFEHVSRASGISALTQTFAGWGMKFLDYDNDGWKDIFVGQGHVLDDVERTQPQFRYRQPFLLLQNEEAKYNDASRQGGPAFAVRRAARGVGFGDFNSDGFVDIAVNCNDAPAVLLQNTGASGNHWITIDLIGRRSNRDGIGAKVDIIAENGAKQYAMVSAASSYLSASDKRVHFGLGSSETIKSLQVRWPSGELQTLKDLAVDRVLKIEEPVRK